MAEQIHVKKTRAKSAPPKQEEVEAIPDEEAQRIKDEADALLDEIDEELAENDEFWASIDEALGDRVEHAQAYIDSFINKGGQ